MRAIQHNQAVKPLPDVVKVALSAERLVTIHYTVLKQKIKTSYMDVK